MNIKIEVKQFLDDRKMSQYRLAKLSGVTQPTINRLVNGACQYISCTNADKLRAAMAAYSAGQTEDAAGETTETRQ